MIVQRHVGPRIGRECGMMEIARQELQSACCADLRMNNSTTIAANKLPTIRSR